MVCTHCGRTNQTVETYFIKYGYPPGFKNQPQATSSANHISDNPSVGSTNIDFGFTQEQYKDILELLQHSRPNPTTNSITSTPLSMNTNSTLKVDKHLTSWILDTSATYHITFHLDSFITHKTIKPIPVTLPNGTHIVASIYVDKTPSPPINHVHTLDDISILGHIPDHYVPTGPTSPPDTPSPFTPDIIVASSSSSNPINDMSPSSSLLSQNQIATPTTHPPLLTSHSTRISNHPSYL
ncbi:hypothetical protein KIW84_014741 [Lathyrus oleraceus]|uniref:Uncharacterized protein n=1 Tax=Pisum sativum TaxID=3888 RepID=A0A9D5BNW5_PEA|nr:hypothetical protein KIW84_014741 [Pisum sativum]